MALYNNLKITEKKTQILNIVNSTIIVEDPHQINPHKRLYLYFQHEHSIQHPAGANYTL